jgi:hypothetical protein
MRNTARTSIAKALAEKLNSIDGSTGYNTNINGNAYPKLKFWDEVNNFPSIYMSIGGETREYMPGNFKWGFLSISLKVYVKNQDDAAQELEDLLADIEKVLDANRTLEYDETNPNARTVEILINSIVTDEGLLEPYGVGEINISVQYPVL